MSLFRVKTKVLIWLVKVFISISIISTMLIVTKKFKTRRQVLFNKVKSNDSYMRCFSSSTLKDEIVDFRKTEEFNLRKYSMRADHFTDAVMVDTYEDEKKCPFLYEAAREMLNGAKIKLPSQANETRWDFRKRTYLNQLNATKLRWNAPWKKRDLQQTKKILKQYNVSAKTIKNRKILITYGHNCCRKSKARAIESAVRTAKMDYAEALDLSALSLPFQVAHGKHLRWRKGAGYWLWKPYIVLQTLIYKMNDGDMLIYQDSGMYFTNDAGPLLKLCKGVEPSILTFASPYEESRYSKRDAFVLMDMDDPRVYGKGQKQRIGGLIVSEKNCENIQFFMEWLAYTMDYRISKDNPNVMGKQNFPNFVGTRHDQTVLSLLSKKWGILEVRDPCSCGRNGFDRNAGYISGPYRTLYVNDRKMS